MPRAVQRRRGEGCHAHGWDCARGGDSGYVSARCAAILPGSSGAEEPENDPGVEAIMVESLVRREGLSVEAAVARRATEAAAAVVEQRRRAALTPGARCALDDAADRAFWAGLDERRAASAVAAQDRRRAAAAERAQVVVAAPVPAAPEVPGERPRLRVVPDDGKARSWFYA